LGILGDEKRISRKKKWVYLKAYLQVEPWPYNTASCIQQNPCFGPTAI